MEKKSQKTIFEIAAKIVMFCDEADKNIVEAKTSSQEKNQNKAE